jgi:hypothetical protein
LGSDGYEREPSETHNRELSKVSLPGLRKYYTGVVLGGSGIQFCLRVLVPVRDVRRLQTLLTEYCVDGCVHAVCFSLLLLLLLLHGSRACLRAPPCWSSRGPLASSALA